MGLIWQQNICSYFRRQGMGSKEVFRPFIIIIRKLIVIETKQIKRRTKPWYLNQLIGCCMSQWLWQKCPVSMWYPEIKVTAQPPLDTPTESQKYCTQKIQAWIFKLYCWFFFSHFLLVDLCFVWDERVRTKSIFLCIFLVVILLHGQGRVCSMFCTVCAQVFLYITLWPLDQAWGTP